MPSNQTAKSSSTSRGSASANKQPQSRPAARSQSRGQTGERDEHYALVSVLYHALQAAETTDQYIQDARDAEDEELVSFFEETKEAYIERAAEAKELLAARLESESEDEEEDEEEDDVEEEEEED